MLPTMLISKHCFNCKKTCIFCSKLWPGGRQLFSQKSYDEETSHDITFGTLPISQECFRCKNGHIFTTALSCIVSDSLPAKTWTLQQSCKPHKTVVSSFYYSTQCPTMATYNAVSSTSTAITMGHWYILRVMLHTVVELKHVATNEPNEIWEIRRRSLVSDVPQHAAVVDYNKKHLCSHIINILWILYHITKVDGKTLHHEVSNSWKSSTIVFKPNKLCLFHTFVLLVWSIWKYKMTEQQFYHTSLQQTWLLLTVSCMACCKWIWTVHKTFLHGLHRRHNGLKVPKTSNP